MASTSTAGPLLTAAEFAAGTGGAVSESDPRVEPMLSGVTAAIRRYCGWHIAPVVTETDVLLDSNGGNVLVVPTLRLLAVEAVATRAGSTWSDLSADDIANLEWSGSGMVRRHCWPDRYRGVRLTYSHGFEQADVGDLLQVIQQVVAIAIASPMGVVREQDGPFSVSFSTTSSGVSGGVSLLDRDRAVVDRYRLPARV